MRAQASELGLGPSSSTVGLKQPLLGQAVAPGASLVAAVRVKGAVTV